MVGRASATLGTILNGERPRPTPMGNLEVQEVPILVGECGHGQVIMPFYACASEFLNY